MPSEESGYPAPAARGLRPWPAVRNNEALAMRLAMNRAADAALMASTP